MEEILICGIRRLGILCLKDAHATWPQSIHLACSDWGYVIYKGFSQGSAGKESACNSEDLGSIPGLGRSPGEGKCYPLRYSDLENSVDSIAHGVAKESDMTERLSRSYIYKIKMVFFCGGSVQFSSVTQSCPTLWEAMNRSRPGAPVHYQLQEFTQTHMHWVGDAIQPSHPLLSPSPSCPQSFPASGSFQMSHLFSSAGQSIGISASTSVLPMNTQDWSPLGWTGWIFLQSKGLSRVFSNTTVQKLQFFCVQLSL